MPMILGFSRNKKKRDYDAVKYEIWNKCP